MEALSLTLRSVSSSKARQVERQQLRFEEGRLALEHLIECEPQAPKRIKAMLDAYKDLPMIVQPNESTDTFITNLERFVAKTESLIKAQSLRYKHAILYTDILKEWRDSSDEAEALIDDSGVEIPNLTPSREEYRQRLFNSTATSAKALETSKTEIPDFEQAMKQNKEHFTTATMNWCIYGLLRSDLLNDDKRACLTAIQQDKDALGDVMDDLNMRMSTLDRWAWSSDGIPAEQRRQVGSKSRIFHDEDLMDALLLRYIGAKWSVRMSKSLTRFAKAHAWLSPSNLLSNNEWLRREEYLGFGKEHATGICGERLETYESDYFLTQLLKHEAEVDRGYDIGHEQEDEEKSLKTRKSITELKHSLLRLLNTEVAVAKRLNDEVTVLQSDFKSFGPSIPHGTIFAVLKFFSKKTVLMLWFESANVVRP
ncbi:MAG: hypothetical protein Q9166_000649 [cf. Caloplaca sp. 2 TL-2023]